jgi:hypothetical protein
MSSTEGTAVDTDATEPEPMRYQRVRAEFAAHPVRRADVPVQHALSLPVPTRRWGRPAWAGFAGAAHRVPDRPLRLAVPDRWWALLADRPRLLAYNLTAAAPFTDAALTPVEVDHRDRTVTDLREDLRQLDELMDAVAPAFLADRAGRELAEPCGDLAEVFSAYVTAAALGWYRALAPDFFGWLEGGSGA